MNKVHLTSPQIYCFRPAHPEPYLLATIFQLAKASGGSFVQCLEAASLTLKQGSQVAHILDAWYDLAVLQRACHGRSLALSPLHQFVFQSNRVESLPIILPLGPYDIAL